LVHLHLVYGVRFQTKRKIFDRTLSVATHVTNDRACRITGLRSCTDATSSLGSEMIIVDDVIMPPSAEVQVSLTSASTMSSCDYRRISICCLAALPGRLSVCRIHKAESHSTVSVNLQAPHQRGACLSSARQTARPPASTDPLHDPPPRSRLTLAPSLT
jgi:hypothetical protein